MAGPQERNIDQATANQVVEESLGISMEDIGGNRPDDSFENDGDDNLDDGGNEPVARGNNDQLDGGEGDDDLFETPQERPQRQERQPEPQAPIERQHRPLAATPEVRIDGRGNIIDKATGQVVARAGREARYYQGMHKARQKVESTQAIATDMEARLKKAVELGTGLFERLQAVQQNGGGDWAPDKHGLSDTEAREAYSFAREAKTDPVGTIKKLLTRAAAGGIDLSSIGLAGGNFDPKSLMDLVQGEISKHMKPLQERTQRETAQEQQAREVKEANEATTKELTDFLGQNPDAKNYLPIFQKVYEQPQFQHMTLGEVWARLQLNLLRRGNQQPPARQQQRPQNQNRRNPRPPNGQSRPPRGTSESNLAPVTMSYEDIVRGLLTPK